MDTVQDILNKVVPIYLEEPKELRIARILWDKGFGMDDGEAEKFMLTYCSGKWISPFQLKVVNYIRDLERNIII